MEANWYSVQQVAEMVGSCRQTVLRAIRKGYLKSSQLNGPNSPHRITPDAVQAWLKPPTPAAADVDAEVADIIGGAE